MGVELSLEDWQTYGYDVPLLVNLQPAGEYLGEDFHRAGGVPAVVNELMKQGLIHEDALTVNGRTHRRELPRAADHRGRQVIRPFEHAAEGRRPASSCCAAICSTPRS